MAQQDLGFCIIKEIETALSNSYGDKVGRKFRADVKRTYGISRLHGMPQVDQIRWINRYWRQKFGPMAGTMQLRQWIEDISDTNEYLNVFRAHWMNKVYQTGVYS